MSRSGPEFFLILLVYGIEGVLLFVKFEWPLVAWVAIAICAAIFIRFIEASHERFWRTRQLYESLTR